MHLLKIITAPLRIAPCKHCVHVNVTGNSKGGGGEEGGGGGNSGMFYWCNTATLHLRGQRSRVAICRLTWLVCCCCCASPAAGCVQERVFSNDMEQELGEQLLSSLFASKLKQASKQSAPYWRLSLNNLCRLAGGMLLGGEAEEAAWRRRSGEEAEEGEEEEDEDEEGEQQMMMREWSNQRLEELYNLQNICRALLHSRQGRLRHDSREYAAGNGGEAALKRKSPYILKRQATHLSKSRRPYILKRSEIY
ncbi:neurotensin/neuromedin N isoform 5-T6 [Syngnathus typhle]